MRPQYLMCGSRTLPLWEQLTLNENYRFLAARARTTAREFVLPGMPAQSQGNARSCLARLNEEQSWTLSAY